MKKFYHVINVLLLVVFISFLGACGGSSSAKISSVSIYKDAVAEYQQIIQAAQQNGTDVTTDAFKAYAQLTVENYARRVELAHQELDWGLGVNNNNYEVAGLTQADMENNNADAVKAAYENFANGEIAYYDTNNDEVITIEEYQALSGAKSAEDKALVQSNFNIIDYNNDGKIDGLNFKIFNSYMHSQT